MKVLRLGSFLLAGYTATGVMMLLRMRTMPQRAQREALVRGR
jgi:hypothetical protein